jgi:hypothetical protein
VTPDDFIEAALQHVNAQPACEPNGEWEIKGSRVWIELREKPETLLSKR